MLFDTFATQTCYKLITMQNIRIIFNMQEFYEIFFS